MQTVAGMGSSLFVKKGAGLYYTPTRRKIPINGLVLYLPLWHPGLAGSTIVSKDLGAQSFDVTDATWGAQGRTFNGSSAIITRAVDDWQIADSAGTIIVWFKYTASAGYCSLFTSSDADTTAYYINFGIHDTDNISISQLNNDVAGIVRGSTDIADSAWHMGAVVSNGTAWALYVDLTTESLTIAGGANNGDWFADTAARNNASVGALKRLSIVNYFTGTIGDVLVYNRVLSTTEIKNIYQATKWRYT